MIKYFPKNSREVGMSDSDDEKKKKRLGEMLLEAGYIDEIQLAVALGQQKQYGGKLGIQLLKLGFVPERTLADILKQQLGITLVTLYEKTIPQEVIETIPFEIAFKYTVIPVDADNNTITLATTNPSDLATIDELAFCLNKKIRPVMALDWDIERAIIAHYKFEDEQELKQILKKYGWEVKEFSPIKIEDFLPDNMIDVRQKMHLQNKAKAQADRPKDEGHAKKAVSLNASGSPNKSLVQEALLRILIRKKIITKDELLNEILKLTRKGDKA